MLSRRCHGRNLCRRVHSGGCRATGVGISTRSIGKATVWGHAIAMVGGHGWEVSDRYSTGDSGRLPLRPLSSQNWTSGSESAISQLVGGAVVYCLLGSNIKVSSGVTPPYRFRRGRRNTCGGNHTARSGASPVVARPSTRQTCRAEPDLAWRSAGNSIE